MEIAFIVSHDLTPGDRMLVHYGDSMLSGFPTMREAPSHMILPATAISDEPLVSMP
jgi:hypothetical protein